MNLDPAVHSRIVSVLYAANTNEATNSTKGRNRLKLQGSHGVRVAYAYACLISIAFITGNSSLEPLLEGLCAQIHVNLSCRVFGRNRTGDLTDY